MSAKTSNSNNDVMCKVKFQEPNGVSANRFFFKLIVL